MSFTDLKKKSKNRKELLQKQLEENNKRGSDTYKDDRQWYPERDDAGNGAGIIRFLPAPEGEDVMPFVQRFSHGFQGPGGGWFIENCPTTISNECPLCTRNSELWNTGVDANKDIARDRKRKLSYYANILVIKDPKTPENEGEVFIFRFGQQIFDVLQGAYAPEEDALGDTPEAVDPYDFWEGANFKLRIRKVKGQTNYQQSEFEDPSALFDGDDDALKQLWKREYSLQEFVGKDEFKSHEELTDRLNRVLGESTGNRASSAEEAAQKEADEEGPTNPEENNGSADEAATSEGEGGGDAFSKYKELLEDS